MKILYISAIGKRSIKNLLGEEKLYNMKSISNIINRGITNKIDGAEITMVNDIHKISNGVDKAILDEFEIFLCDLTTMNANVAYVAGQVEILEKPILYFKSNDAVIPVAFDNMNILNYSDTSIESEFLSEITKQINFAIKNPTKFKKAPKKSKSEPKAFLSYSHKDKKYLERLKVHLKPLIKKGLIDIWDDSKIKTGDKWQDEIENALSSSNIAILLISADFMASDFIVDNELPPLLSKAELKGTIILPVIISYCRFDREPLLNRFQSVNPPNEPLSSLEENKREKIYDQLARDIEQAISKV